MGSYDSETGHLTVDFSAPLYQDVLLLSKIFMEVIGDHNSFDGQADPGDYFFYFHISLNANQKETN
jgi:hypothetical protein